MVTSSHFEVSISIGYKVMVNYSKTYPDTMSGIFLIKLQTEGEVVKMTWTMRWLHVPIWKTLPLLVTKLWSNIIFKKIPWHNVRVFPREIDRTELVSEWQSKLYRSFASKNLPNANLPKHCTTELQLQPPHNEQSRHIQIQRQYWRSGSEKFSIVF